MNLKSCKSKRSKRRKLSRHNKKILRELREREAKAEEPKPVATNRIDSKKSNLVGNRVVAPKRIEQMRMITALRRHRRGY